MKKFIIAAAFLLLSAIQAGSQQTSPPDTGSVQIPSQPDTPADTGAIPPPETVPADTAAPPQEPRDTTAVSPPSEIAPAPSDTGATAIPAPAEAPVDSGEISTPTETPADTSAAAPAEPAAPPAEPEKVLQPTRPTEAPKAATEEPAGGQEPKVHRVAFGIVFNDEAPLAMRAWFNPKVGLDAGLGIAVRTVEDLTATVPSPESTTTFLDLSFDLGLPVRIFRREKVDFIIRPGFGFRTRPGFFAAEDDPNVRSEETSLELEINGSAGFEYYPFERTSFGLTAGVALVANRTGGTGNTVIQFKSLPSEKGANFTFRYYAF
jgi:hypothetical protein